MSLERKGIPDRPMNVRRRARRLDAPILRSLLCTHIDSSLELLQSRALTDRTVHSARKAIQRARATLRLLRDCMGETTYRRENEALRSAALPLSPARDAKILIDALDALADRSACDPDAARTLRGVLMKGRHRMRNMVTLRNAASLSGRRLRGVRQRALRWKLDTGDRAQVVDALKRSYRRCRREMRSAETHRSPGSLHKWRKQTKYLWHQLELLERLRAGEQRGRTRQLHRLSDRLGQDHDLAVLRETVRKHDVSFTPAGSKALLSCIDKRRASLQRKAFTLGKRIFQRTPSEFAHRLDATMRVQ